MTDIQRADAVYAAVEAFLQDAKLQYEADEEKRTVFVTITGDDFPVPLIVSVSAEHQRVDVLSQMPYTVKRERAVDIALCAAAVNRRIADGKLCVYFDTGVLTYENSAIFAGLSGFTADYGKAVVASAYAVVEAYNDSLYAVNKGLMSVKDFTATLA